MAKAKLLFTFNKINCKYIAPRIWKEAIILSLKKTDKRPGIITHTQLPARRGEIQVMFFEIMASEIPP